MLTCTLAFRTWLRAACLTLLLAPALHAQTNVRAWHAKGQTWVVWETGGTDPLTYDVYRAPAPFTDTAQAALAGRMFQAEWQGKRLKLAGSSLTWRVPAAVGGTYQLAANEGLFVFTPHAAASEYFAVVKSGSSTVSGTNRTAAAVPYGYDPVNDPVSCHLQSEGATARGHPYAIYAMWADGRDDPADARPDFPVTANAARNGVPHLFSVFEPVSGLPAGPVPAVICLHGGGQAGSYWEWQPGSAHYANDGNIPALGITIAHDDRLVRKNAAGAASENGTTYWFGYSIGFNPLATGNPPSNAVVTPYTLRRLLWIQDWLETRSPYSIDRERVSVMGNSMGGAGTLLLSRFRPERFASASAFVPTFYIPPTQEALIGSSAQNLTTTETGPGGSPLHVADFFDPVVRVSAAQRDYPVLRMYRGRWENDAEPGKWAEVVQAYTALNDAGWGVHLYWDERDHTASDWATDDPLTPEVDIGQWVFPVRTERGSVDYQARYRASQSYPGFSNDDQDAAQAGRQPDIGDGGMTSGAPWGTWSGYTDWELDTIADAADTWACTIFLVGRSAVSVDNYPGSSAAADVTIRKPQQFKPAPGAPLAWSLRRVSDNAVLQNGTTAPDANGLVRVKGLTFYKDPDRARLTVTAGGSSSAVRAWHAKGQTWVVWKIGATKPQAYDVYRSAQPMTSTSQGVLCGYAFQPEWEAARLKLMSASATWRVPLPEGGTYQLAADEGLFVHTPHAAADEYFAVVAHGETIVAADNRTAAAAHQGYDPANDPVQCHLQTSGVTAGGYPYSAYAMWADGRADPQDARPDFPVMANAAKHGAPHVFGVYEPKAGLPACAYPAVICLHGGGSSGSWWEWRPDYGHYANIGHAPSAGITIAHDDRLFIVGTTDADGDGLKDVETDLPTFWLGWFSGLDAFDRKLPPSGAVVVPYTLRRLAWIQDWIETRSAYRIDTDRVAILGSSMGGHGTSLFSRWRPERFSSASCFVPPFYGCVNTALYYLLGAPSQNLLTTEVGPGGTVLRVSDLFDPAKRLSAAQRDLCFTRVYRGRHEDPNNWGPDVIQAFNAHTLAAWGAHLYWDDRDHSPYDWSTDNPATPEVDIGQWVFPVRTERGAVDYQARYRVRQSFPAFFNDDQDPASAGRQPNPGNGDPADGDPWGTWCGYFDWDLGTLVDAPARWECTLFLVGTSPVSIDNFPGASATTHLAIRKSQAFRPAPGQSIAWRLRRLADGAILQEGSVQPDADGVVAIQGLTIRKDPDRSRIELAVQTAASLLLRNGYNLIALPVRPWGTPFTAESLAQHLAANSAPPVSCTSVIRYVSASGQFETHPVGTAVSNFEIAVGIGYFIRCQVAGSSATWTLTGCPLSDPSAQLALAGGYNLIGLPRQPATPYTAEEAGIEINGQQGSATQIIRYDAETGQFVTHPIGTAVANFTLQPGEGYFIRCGGPSLWVLGKP